MLLLLLAAGITAQAQILVKVNGDIIDFKSDKLHTITANYNEISFDTENGGYSFDIRELDALYFAETPTSVEELPAGQTAIVYDEQNDVVYVEPNKQKIGQSTINGNTFRSTSFWMSFTSFILTLVTFFTR